MQKRKIIIVSIVVIAAAGALYAYTEYNRKPKDLHRVKPGVELTATSLINAFENDEQKANNAYLDKVIAVEGQVKEIEKNENGFYTIILGEEGTTSSVRCSMDSKHQQEAAELVKGSAVKVKGVCTGFNSDELLGSDVILNRSVINN